MNMRPDPNYKSFTAVAAVLLAAVMFHACAPTTFQSARYDFEKNKARHRADGYGPREGMAYFLPKGYVHVTADLRCATLTNATDGRTELNPVNYYDLKVDVQILPDAARMYLLEPKLSMWAHDTFGIAVSNGLLSSISSTNVDRSHDVMVSLAGLAGALATEGAAPGLPVKFLPPKKPELPRHIEVSFAPNADGTILDTVSNALDAGSLQILVRPFDGAHTTNRLPQSAGTDFKSGPGIFYRPLLPWNIVINDTRARNNMVFSSVVLLPNDAPVLSLVPRRTTMVTQKTDIVFQNGSPVAFTLDRESPAAVWAALPLDMIKAFMSVPTEMLQLKLNFANTNAALTAAETTNLKNRLELLQKQVELQNFSRTNGVTGR